MNFTFKTHNDFERHVVPVEYKKENIKYEVYSQPLWDWALDLLDNPLLAPQFPWTGDCWSNLQVSFSFLPHNGAPFAFILYADKMHLSSASTVKAYPVIAHCRNLPVEIRNVDGPGGGHLVGWLPIVIWHKSFTILLKTLSLISKTGFAHQCYDGILRWLFPLILILLANYKEQCVMALIQGFNSTYPCPICLVLKDKLTDHSTIYPTHVIDDAQACVQLWNMDCTASEAALKKQSLRPVNVSDSFNFLALKSKWSHNHQNSLWIVKWSSLHDTLSQDTLHTYNSGLFGNHMFEEVKNHLKTLGHTAEKTTDDQFAAFPQCFSDGNNYLDISKVHFRALYQIEAMTDIFLMVHSMRHIFSDIRAKGAARNFSTWSNEKHHGPIKRAYKLQTNGKDITNQILRFDHTTFVSVVLHNHINHFNDERHKAILLERELEIEDLDDRSFGGHIHLGAPQSTITFAQLENNNVSNHAFWQFCKKLSTFLNHTLPAYNIPLPNGKTWLMLSAQDTVQEHQYLKVNYESVVDWKLTTNHLCCNPSFHGCERCDCALVRTQDKDRNNKNILVHILFMFKQSISSQTLDLALVQPMDALMGPQHAVDRDLRLRCLHA
ncbi:hypothetical protein BD769DRAFT_1625525 [Suillus cothurnatus]|nr:hypothetical protein BD769DRAFT_1625525 [Suillus cothurnatus]